MTMTRHRAAVTDVPSAPDTTERAFDDRLAQILWPWLDEEPRPALDLCVTDDAVIARVALPGVAPASIEVTITGDLVMIHGSCDQDAEGSDTGYVRREIRRGSVRRTFTVPVAITADAATASLVDGLLTVTMPRAEIARPTRVAVELRDEAPAP